MKKNISVVLFIIVIVLIGFLIGKALFNSRPNKIYDYNYKKGDVLNIDDFEITILNIAENKCNRNEKCDKEIEVSIKVKYDDIYTYYTLQSYHKPESIINNTAYKIKLTFVNDQIKFEIQ